MECERLTTAHMRNVDCRYLEIDEMWTFCRKKEGHLSLAEQLDPNLGDQYVFFAIDHETKLIPAWLLGKRSGENAIQFLTALKGTLNGRRPQISTDAWPAYEYAIEWVFGSEVDYAFVDKDYTHGRAIVTGVKKTPFTGHPREDRICTSIVERSNLTVRTFQRRLTRRALGYSKKIEHLRAALALHFAYYNFVWQPAPLSSLTPALTAGVTDRLWSVEDLLNGC